MTTTSPCRTINANNAVTAPPSPSGMIFHGCRDFVPIDRRLVKSSSRGLNLPTKRLAWSLSSPGRSLSSSPVASSSRSAAVTSNLSNGLEALEEGIEKVKRVIDST